MLRIPSRISNDQSRSSKDSRRCISNQERRKSCLLLWTSTLSHTLTRTDHLGWQRRAHSQSLWEQVARISKRLQISNYLRLIGGRVYRKMPVSSSNAIHRHILHYFSFYVFSSDHPRDSRVVVFDVDFFDGTKTRFLYP